MPGGVRGIGDAVEGGGSEVADVAEQDDGAGFLRSFGRQLKLLREREGLSRAQLGARLGYGEDQIASVELGRRIPRLELIEKADQELNAGGVLIAMKDEVARARYPAFFRDAAKLEAEAVELQSYDIHVVNGLLQTEEYMRALLAMRRPLLEESVIEQRVAARLARQELFACRISPLMSFVMEESVLLRRLGGTAVMRGQLEQILLAGQRRNVEAQVMPLDREDNAGIDGGFTLFTRKGGEQIGYMETQGHSTLVTDREEVRALGSRHGIIRAQALTPRESLAYIEKLLGEL
ncbi:Scr1 family TA system antitoxin-like transcriptional regulator [Kitasatospora sp. NPDC017646]|uniref:helix-turn-helix domain-containing protein n=1 Tax=Kitasatospora sp. NPDC017646 TaxID=3364024 RepID=UPI0037A1E32D